ncbi:hypothetical protein Tco_0623048 [Tanacetum coccineum]
MNEPHPAYDFFAPAPLHEYAGNPNNNNGWLAADDYLLGELEAMVNKQMVVPAVIAPVVDVVEEDLAVLFSDDDFGDNASDRFGEEEVWEVNEDWLMSLTTPPPVLAVPPPNVYEVGGPSTAVAEGPSFPQGSDAEIAAGVTIREISLRVLAVEGQMQVELGQHTSTQRDETRLKIDQQVQALQVDVQQRDTQIQQLQTTVTEMSSRESMLMRGILGLGKGCNLREVRPNRDPS